MFSYQYNNSQIHVFFSVCVHWYITIWIVCPFRTVGRAKFFILVFVGSVASEFRANYETIITAASDIITKVVSKTSANFQLKGHQLWTENAHPTSWASNHIWRNVSNVWCEFVRLCFGVGFSCAFEFRLISVLIIVMACWACCRHSWP